MADEYRVTQAGEKSMRADAAQNGASSRAGILFVSALFLASCDTSTSLCCGYETREDWTSDVSIVRGDGLVVFQYVSAIVEQEDGYVVEVRPIDENAPKLTYKDCEYARIDKDTGARSSIGREALQSILNEELSSGEAELVLRTQNSCLVESPQR